MKSSKKVISLIISFIVLVTSILSVPMVASAATDFVYLSDLTAGSIVSFGGTDWIVLDPANGYLLLKDHYKMYNSDLLVYFKFDDNGSNVYDPDSYSNIAYKLNNNFYNGLISSDAALIRDTTWHVDNEEGQGSNYVACKIGMISNTEITKYQGLLGTCTDSWWTRSSYSMVPGSVCTVSADGSFGGAIPANTDTAVMVRPTLHISPNLLVWTGNNTVLGGTYNIPSVTGISEQSGLFTGGTEVTITGTGFNGATKVYFGSTEGTNLQINSGTSITVTSPSGSGTVDITVECPWGTSSVNENGRFTYTEGTGIITGTVNDGVNPVAGASVSLTGTGFVNSGVTVSDGTYIFNSVPVGTGYTLTASKEGYTSGNATDVSVVFNNTTSDVDISLSILSCNVEVSASPVEEGSVSGGGTYNYGESVTVLAQANNGYIFTNWTENAVPVSTDASYTFTMGAVDRILVANFSVIPTLNSIAITTLPQQRYTVGDSLNIDGMVVTGSYSDGSTKVENVTSANVTGFNSSAPAADQVLTVTVGEKTATYTINITNAGDLVLEIVTNPVTGGTVTGDGFYSLYDMVTLRAEANDGYSFVNWTKDGYEYSTDATYLFPINRDCTWVANFSEIATTLTSIDITSPPTKLTYTLGESLNIDGLVVTGTYGDGSTQTINVTTANITGFDSNIPAANQVLTVIVDGKTATYTIDVTRDSYIATPMVDAGMSHVVALRDDGTVWAWGNNNKGQLGNNNPYNYYTVQVSGLSKIKEVSAGNDYSLALSDTGTVWAWGDNTYGQLGNGSTTISTIPVALTDLTDVVAVSAGGNRFLISYMSAHSVALKSDGTVWAWGDNSLGQLGDGTTTQSNVPVQVQGLPVAVTAVNAGGGFTAALGNDNKVYTWGENQFGQLGNGENTNSLVPVQVSGLENVTAISAGSAHTLALKDDGTVWAWGWNSDGCLGNGTASNSNVPVQVSGLSNIISVAAGEFTSMALDSSGSVWVWGANYINTPQKIDSNSNYIAVSSGAFASYLMINTNGTVTVVDTALHEYIKLGNGICLIVDSPAFSTGNISGMVFNGMNLVAGANVSLTVNAEEYTAVTDLNGSYYISGVPIGSGYTLTASKEGYSTGNVTNKSVEFNKTTLGANIYIIPLLYKVEVSASSVEEGTISGGGTYSYGTSVTVRAQANYGYTFENWTESGSIVSTDANYTFTIGTADRTLLANFIPAAVTAYTVTFDKNGGDTEADPATKTAESGGNVGTLPTAPSMSGYTFTGWNTEADGNGTEFTATTLVTGDITVYAQWTQNVPSSYTVTVSGMPPFAGSVSGGGIYKEGASVTVTATANIGFDFIGWTESGSIVSTDVSYTFTMGTADRTLMANFIPAAVTTYTVTFNKNGGDTEADPITKTAASGGNVGTLPTAPSMSGYTFTGWNTEADGNGTEFTASTLVTGDITVYAQWTQNVPSSYTVTVSGMPPFAGSVSGGGIYKEGASVTVTATANIGFDFIGWTESGSIVSTDVSYTFNMGTADRTLLTNFIPAAVTTYTVTFDKNGGDTEADPATKTAAAGGNVGTLPTEPMRSGYTFNGWNTAANGTGTAFTAATEVNADLTVYAQWTKKTSGGSSGGGGTTTGTLLDTPSVPPVTITETPSTGNVPPSVTAVMNTEAKADSNGNAAAEVTVSQMTDAINKAVEAALQKGGDTQAKVEIKVTAPADAKSVETSIQKVAFAAVADGKIDELTVSTPVATITFDKEALSTISKEAEGDVKITASKVDSAVLSEDIKQTVGDRPVFNFSVTSRNKTITQFGGNVTVSVPYTPKEGEDINAVVIYYINAEGKVEIVSNCKYDPVTGTIKFTTNHFSTFAVGYNKVSFTDVPADAAYSKAVSFIAARGITSGTGDGKFSPEAAITRGQFIVMVMRAYRIKPDKISEDNFSDAGNTYYTNYLSTAKRLGLTNGTGNNNYSPDKEITRQEMIGLLYNTLKVMGELPTAEEGKDLTEYTDANQIASWAKDAMTLFVEAGIIKGTDNKLQPAEKANRAEMAQMLYNLLGK